LLPLYVSIAPQSVATLSIAALAAAKLSGRGTQIAPQTKTRAHLSPAKAALTSAHIVAADRSAYL